MQLIETAERALQTILNEASEYKYALDEPSIFAITDAKRIINHANHNY